MVVNEDMKKYKSHSKFNEEILMKKEGNCGV